MKFIKIGFGVLAFTAASSAAAGYMLAKRDMADRYDGDGEGEDAGADAWDGAVSTASALKEMVSAGRDMKRAWSRLERSAKIVLARSQEEGVDDGDDEDDEDEE